MTEPPEKTLRKLWQRWLKSTLLDEFRRADNIKGQTGKAKHGFTKLSERRQTIEYALQNCPIGSWSLLPGKAVRKLGYSLPDS